MVLFYLMKKNLALSNSKLFPLIFFTILATFFVTGPLYAQIQFIENKGQWDSRIKYMSKAGDGAFFLEAKGYTITQHHPDDAAVLMKNHHKDAGGEVHEKNASKKLRSHSYTVQFLNAGNARIIPEKPITTVNNYFIGNDKSKWAQDCKIYQVITYKDIYPGIDARYYVDGANNLKYDLIVHPGADVDNIAMKYTGADNLAVKNKELVITTTLGKSKELKPYTYQVIDNQRSEVECGYEIKGDVVKFKIKNYSPDKTLIIDPTQVFFSYSGSTADNWGFTATYGPDGSFYGGGIVMDAGFPTSPGGYDGSFGGDFDIGIIKLSPDGKRRIYATYIGGAGKEQPHSLIVDAQGNLILAGRTNSTDYPATGTYGDGGGWDIVVTKLNATGGNIVGSLKIGGKGTDGVNISDNTVQKANSLKRNYGDDARSEVILDGSNNILVASCTSSSDFKTSPGAFQSQNAGGQDAVVLKIDPSCNTVLFSTLLGGTKNDAGYVLTMGNNGNIFVAGGTGSSDLNGISPNGVIKPTYSEPNITNDDCDGFVIELNAAGSAVAKGTYIGTARADQIYGISVDKSGFIYIMGTSEGNMLVINAAYSVAGAKQFISKISQDLSAFVYSTIFGSANAGVPNISPTAFLVDRCENVYVSGWGGKANANFTRGNTRGMPTTPGAIKPVSDPSGSDFYFFVLEKNANSQLYGTFFGQDDTNSFGDHVDGGTSRFDRNGIIYQAICANCGKNVPFPGNPGSWSPTNQATTGGYCNLGMLKIEMDFTGVRSGLQASIDGVPNDTIGCVPLRVDFKDTLELGKLYYWDFGDGTGDTTTVFTNSHIYNNTGNYLVRLISIDSLTCNIADTSYKTIRVGSNKANLDFVAQKLQPCTSLGFVFTNTSTATRGGFNPGTFTWDFGDNTSVVTQGLTPPVTHTYAGPGTYNVKLTINDITFCNSPDDTIKAIRLSPEVKAIFTTPARGCVPYNAVFANKSLGGLNFEWDFGDGTGSTEVDPAHLYNNIGTYVVKLRAYDSTSCNLVDSTSFTITVSGLPVASFTYNPIEPEENTPVNFVNKSLGASSYLWDFGDGDTSTLLSPRHLFNATGTYNVCLQATNDAGCIDDTCLPVRSVILPLLDVPTAFTPGRFGINSQIKVQGFGISKMQWTIYNRWGQKVYETNSIKSSWDGNFKGKIQPADVYTYTLEATFTDGTTARKTGDITLIR